VRRLPIPIRFLTLMEKGLRMSGAHPVWAARGACLMLLVLPFVPCQARADELATRATQWEKAALICEAGSFRFPSKQHWKVDQPCNDGDMTLFNGLLCAAGDERGCDGVRDAQDSASGLWHRSPRIRLLGKNDEGNADSSPDMALGVQLYLLVKRDIPRAQKWLQWMNSNYFCAPNGSLCILKIPKFCGTDDCIMRPQDAATLAATVNYLQENAGLPALVNGPLRGILGTFSGYGPVAQQVAASVNDPGFPQHLAGVSVWLLRLAGSTDSALASAADTLAARNPGNAFFSWLAGRSKEQVTNETLARCPADPNTLIKPLHQWQWERSNAPNPNDGLYAWQQSSLWDCIFMARLISPIK
jgi:hypothetical protein